MRRYGAPSETGARHSPSINTMNAENIIFVGASAGGVKALQQLVRGFPRDLSAAGIGNSRISCELMSWLTVASSVCTNCASAFSRRPDRQRSRRMCSDRSRRFRRIALRRLGGRLARSRAAHAPNRTSLCSRVGKPRRQKLNLLGIHMETSGGTHP